MHTNEFSNDRGIKVVILAGGRGTRLAPYTMILPKPLMPINDLPVLEIIIRQLRNAGFLDITLSVGHLASLLEAYFGDGNRWGMTIRYSREDQPLGTAGPLAIVPGLTDTFMVMNGDILTTLNYEDMVNFHQKHGAVATVGLFKKRVKIDLGVVDTDAEDRITAYVEKPILSYDVSMGVYVMEPSVLRYIPSGERFDLPDLMKRLVAERQLVIGYRLDGYWLDIGRYEDYVNAAELFQREKALFLPKEK